MTASRHPFQHHRCPLVASDSARTPVILAFRINPSTHPDPPPPGRGGGVDLQFLSAGFAAEHVPGDLPWPHGLLPLGPPTLYDCATPAASASAGAAGSEDRG